MKKTMLFIPAYNCSIQLKRILKKIFEHEYSFFQEIVIINNCSTDNIEDMVHKFSVDHPAMPITLLRNNENYGLGGSHKVAFQYAVENHYEYLIVLHGDDQGDLADIVPYITNGAYVDYDSMLGSRFSKGSRLVNYSLFRIFGNKLFNIFFSIILGKRIYDLGSGLNMYKVEYIKNRFYMGFPDTLSFNVFMLLYGVYCGSRFCFFPLTWREEDQVSNVRYWKQTKELLILGFRYIFQRRKLFEGAVDEPNKTYGYSVITKNKEIQ